MNEAYIKHLHSEYWQSFRKAIIAERGNKCEDCGAVLENKDLDLHHLTYENFGQETGSDVVVLCRHCHDKRESIKSAFQKIRERMFKNGEMGKEQLYEHTFLQQTVQKIRQKYIPLFIEMYGKRDVAFGGDLNLTDKKGTVRVLLHEILDSNNETCYTGADTIVDYFKAKRYKAIVELLGNGKSKEEIIALLPNMPKAIITKIVNNTPLYSTQVLLAEKRFQQEFGC